MHFDPSVSWGTIFTGISFVVAVIVFVVAMKPRIDNLEKAVDNNLKWQELHEQLARDRDTAIQALAIEVSKIAALQTNAESRMTRMDQLFEKFVQVLGDRQRERDRG